MVDLGDELNQGLAEDTLLQRTSNSDKVRCQRASGICSDSEAGLCFCVGDELQGQGGAPALKEGLVAQVPRALFPSWVDGHSAAPTVRGLWAGQSPG